jgi:SAM-dependent methyltransferase
MKPALRIEDGVVVGTAGGKYDNPNILARRLIGQFDRAIAELAGYARPTTILEVGCGEGHVTQLLLDATDARILATDLSATVLEEAQANLSSNRVSYRTVNVMSLEPLGPAPDMVVCCEVLEHLEHPQGGLEALLTQRAEWYLLSVPREPIWRAMNIARGAYLKECGNSPGHLQHWSRRGFLRFIGRLFRPVIVRAPLPWTVVLCQPHGQRA